MKPHRFGGVGFFAGLTLLFIGLKLTNMIDWSWLWVLSPIWIPFVFIVLLGVVVVIAEECDRRSSR